MSTITSFNQLRVFVQIASDHSFSKAADSLRITQPAVSIQMKQLEEALRVKLVDRLKGPTYLTAEGRILFDNAKKILDLLNNIDLELINLKELKLGTLSLGASTVPSVLILPAAIAEFKHRYPETHFSLRVAKSEVVERWVVDNEVDLAMIWGDPFSPQIQKQYFSEEELVLVIPPKHPLRSRKSVSIAEICDQYLLISESGKLKSLIETCFVDRGLSMKNYSVFGNIEAIKTAISAGLGVSILSRSAVEREAKAGFIVVKPIRDIRLSYRVNVIYHKEKHFSPLALAFRQFLHERSASADR